jgi:hypothetical protein
MQPWQIKGSQDQKFGLKKLWYGQTPTHPLVGRSPLDPRAATIQIKHNISHHTIAEILEDNSPQSDW